MGNLIVAGTNTWSQDVDEASRNQLADSNVAYTLHFYSSMHKQANRDKASVAMSNGAAIFVTEWGVEQNGEGNSETNTWLDFLRQHGISNAMWGIYDKDSEAWAIVHSGASGRGGWSAADLTNTGRLCLYLHLVSLRLRLLLHAFLHSPVLKLGLLDMVTLVPYKTFFPFYIHHFLGQERFYKQDPALFYQMLYNPTGVIDESLPRILDKHWNLLSASQCMTYRRYANIR